MYFLSFCYSDHNHDIEHVGVCEMCGGTDIEGPKVYKHRRDLYDRVNLALNKM